MPDSTLSAAWIAIANAVNLRDVGGLPCRDGGTTRSRVLLRSGTLRQLTADDAATLCAVYGVSTVVDLRTARELRDDGPSALARHGITTLHVPLIAGDRAALPEADRPDVDPADALRQAYRGLVTRRGHLISTVARHIAGNNHGSTLVHCAAGKDRTGVAVAVVLDAAGVSRDAVLADYEATNEVIGELVATLATIPAYASEVERVPKAAHRTQPQALTELLDHLDRHFGGAAGWLQTRHGWTDTELATLQRRLAQPAASGLPVA